MKQHTRHPGESRGPVLCLMFKTWIPAFAGMTMFFGTTIFFGMMVLAGPVFAQVSLGIDELERLDFEPLKGRSVALITNHTGVDRDGDSTIDILRAAPNVKLVCVLTPEHGFRGKADHGQTVIDWIDPKTKLPIYSLYGPTTRPTAKMLKNVNTIVFDIQDIGTRFYTYITTMGMAMEAAAEKKLRFVVLDRPNPVRGDIIEGGILDPEIRRMTGYFEVPVRHGFTVGELALWFNKVRGVKADLHVVRMKGWKRTDWYDQTGLAFINPSPNIRSLTAALLYPGIGAFEATNVAVGRGTETPFELFGAPWINAKALCAYLREQNFPGVLFEIVEFTPEKDVYAGEVCHGVRLIVTDRETIRPFQIFARAFLFLHKSNPKDFKPEWDEVRVVSGSNKLREASEGKISAEELFAYYESGLAAFREQIIPFILY